MKDCFAVFLTKDVDASFSKTLNLYRFNVQRQSQNAYNEVQGLKNPRLLKMIQASFPPGLLHMSFLHKVSQNIISCYRQLQGHIADA